MPASSVCRHNYLCEQTLKQRIRAQMTKVNWSRNVIVGCIVLLLAACNQVVTPTLPNETFPQAVATFPNVDMQTESATIPPLQETEMDNAQMTQPAIPSGLEALIEKAKDDLAQRLSIPITQITLVEAKEVVWPDASLGCPQDGVMSAQVETDGYLIRLEANAQIYSYHMDEKEIFVVCELELDNNGFQKETDKNVEDGWPSQPKDTEIIKLTPTK